MRAAVRLIARVLVLGTLSYVAGRLAILAWPQSVPPVGLASGVALGALLARGAALWPGALLGAFALHLELGWARDGLRAAPAAACFGALAALQSLVSSALVRRFGGRPLELAREVDILRVALLAAAGCALNRGLLERSVVPWLSAWAGDSLGALLVAPLVLIWSAEPRAAWTPRRVPVTLPLLLMAALVGSLYLWVKRQEEARVRAAFEARSASLARAFDEKLSDTVALARVIEHPVESHISPGAFRQLSRARLSRHPWVQAITWIPWVPSDARETFERVAGIPIVERSKEGVLVPAALRAAYAPVFIAEPRPGNESLTGFDIASDPRRRDALDRARDTGDVAVTSRLSLFQAKGEPAAVILYSPRYRRGAPLGGEEERRAALLGFVGTAPRLDDLAAEALAGRERDGLRLELLDAGGERLWGSAGERTSITVDLLLNVAGRPWTLRVRADAAFAARYATLAPRFVLWGGLLFTALLQAFLLAATGRAVLIERLGAERAEELSRMNASLEREIAGRKAIEESLTRKERELLQSQKMEAIGRIAGGVAHDFNNLLTAILGYTHLLLEREPDGSPRRADLEEILKSSERAAQLTAQLLAFSRKQVLKPAVLEINSVVANLNKMLRRVIGEDIELVTSLPGDVGRIKADLTQIEQVILNLTLNARDAMTKGGRLLLQTRDVDGREDLDGLAVPADLPHGRFVALSIRDTGTGMDEAVLSRLFEPFFTTKELGKGTGLGLSTAYGIISQSGGYIGVRSRPGEGSTFTIFLPRVDDRVDESPAPLACEPKPGRETVLLVEDEEVVRRLSSQVLRQKGYTVVEALNGEDALRVLSQRSEGVDLLITDMIMPKMGGRELAKRVASSHPRLKVLFISGYAETAIIHHGLPGPNTFFLAKPFAPQALARKVREILESTPKKTT